MSRKVWQDCGGKLHYLQASKTSGFVSHLCFLPARRPTFQSTGPPASCACLRPVIYNVRHLSMRPKPLRPVNSSVGHHQYQPKELQWSNFFYGCQQRSGSYPGAGRSWSAKKRTHQIFLQPHCNFLVTLNPPLLPTKMVTSTLGNDLSVRGRQNSLLTTFRSLLGHMRASVWYLSKTNGLPQTNRLLRVGLRWFSKELLVIIQCRITRWPLLSLTLGRGVYI